MSCPLHNPIEKGEGPENPHRWNPQNVVQAHTFQLHDSVLLLYRTSAIKDPDERLKNMLHAYNMITVNMASTEKALKDFADLRKFANKK